MSAPAGTIYYTLDGSDPRLIGGAVAPTAAVYSAGSPPALARTTVVKARVLSGGTWSALTEARFLIGTPAAAGNLAITEINYHPAAPTEAELLANPLLTADSFEFIELRNIGTQWIDLNDVQFTAGVDLRFHPEQQPEVAQSGRVRRAGRRSGGVRTALPGRHGGRHVRGKSEQRRRADHAYGTQRRRRRQLLLQRQRRMARTGRRSGQHAGDRRSGGRCNAGRQLAFELQVPGHARGRKRCARDRRGRQRGAQPHRRTAGRRHRALQHDRPVDRHHRLVAQRRQRRLPEVPDSQPARRCAADAGGLRLRRVLRRALGQPRAGDRPDLRVRRHGCEGFRTQRRARRRRVAAEEQRQQPVLRRPRELRGGLQLQRRRRILRPLAGRPGRLALLSAPRPYAGRGQRRAGQRAARRSAGHQRSDVQRPRSRSGRRSRQPGVRRDLQPDGGRRESRPLAAPRRRGVRVHRRAQHRRELDAGGAAVRSRRSAQRGEARQLPHSLRDFRVRAARGRIPRQAGPQRRQGAVAAARRPAAGRARVLSGPGRRRSGLRRCGPVAHGARRNRAVRSRASARLAWGDNAGAWIAAAPSPGAFYANVVGRNIFYNRSGFDGNNAAANAADDAAIATDKSALLPGAAATLANYTSYTRGINGIMVDVAGRPIRRASPRPTSPSRWATTTRPAIGATRPRPRA